MRLHLDKLSFWFGFIVASIFWWMVAALRPAYREWRDKVRARREEKKMRGMSGLEEKLRQVILRQTQKLHLAHTLFSLDEIVQPPQLIAPPPNLPPAATAEESEEQENILAAWLDDISISAVPYLPDWPEVGALYGVPTLSLPEAAQNVDIALAGQIGMGKTSALAWMASLVARQEPDIPAWLQNKTAFWLHAADTLQQNEDDETSLLKPLTDLINRDASLFEQGRFPALIETLFESGRAILLFDGLDELARAQADRAIRYLARLKKHYPQTRIIAAISPDYLDGLLQLNFEPLALRPWDAAQRKRFVQRWGDLWEEYVIPESWAQELPPHVDSALLNAWLSEHDDWLTPLELTLRTWALYAGDIQGPTPEDAIYTHLRRLLPEKLPFEALEALGLQAALNQTTVFQARDTRQWLKTFEAALEAEEQNEAAAAAGGEANAAPAQTDAVTVKPPRSLAERLVDSGLLITGISGQLRFVHPLFAFFLAGRAAARHSQLQGNLAEQPNWSGKAVTFRYLAHYGDPGPTVQALLANRDHPLERNLLSMGRWLRASQGNAAWRQQILLETAKLLSAPNLPLTQRLQAAAALGLSNTPGIHQFFIKQLVQNNPEILQISALGLGLTRHPAGVSHLAALFSNPNPGVYRAACLALAAIGNDAALEALVDGLINYHDDLRQAAAEALANHPAEGHPTLQDAAQREGNENAALRRAAVYGLARIREPWADALLDQLQYDEEWVVRNGAVALLEARQKANPLLPRPLTPAAKTPWLLAFAARQGVGISPGQDATDIILQALLYGEPAERLAALPYLRRKTSEGVIGHLYDLLRTQDDITLREAVYITLFWISASGIDLPPAEKFGLT